jgi:hypothetical protein
LKEGRPLGWPFSFARYVILSRQAKDLVFRRQCSLEMMHPNASLRHSSLSSPIFSSFASDVIVDYNRDAGSDQLPWGSWSALQGTS